MKNIINTSLFTLIKFITAAEATNLIGYYSRKSKKGNTWEERNERSHLWAVRYKYFSTCICSLQSYAYDRWTHIANCKYMEFFLTIITLNNNSNYCILLCRLESEDED